MYQSIHFQFPMSVTNNLITGNCLKLIEQYINFIH